MKNQQRTFLNRFDQSKPNYREKIRWCLQIFHIWGKIMEKYGGCRRKIWEEKIQNMEKIWWWVWFWANFGKCIIRSWDFFLTSPRMRRNIFSNWPKITPTTRFFPYCGFFPLKFLTPTHIFSIFSPFSSKIWGHHLIFSR